MRLESARTGCQVTAATCRAIRCRTGNAVLVRSSGLLSHWLSTRAWSITLSVRSAIRPLCSCERGVSRFPEHLSRTEQFSSLQGRRLRCSRSRRRNYRSRQAGAYLARPRFASLKGDGREARRPRCSGWRKPADAPTRRWPRACHAPGDPASLGVAGLDRGLHVLLCCAPITEGWPDGKVAGGTG